MRQLNDPLDVIFNTAVIAACKIFFCIALVLGTAQSSKAQEIGRIHSDFIEIPGLQKSSDERKDSCSKYVRIIYLVPADSVEKPQYTLSLTNAAKHLQLWFMDQLGRNRSFSLPEPVVDVIRTTHDALWYSTNPNGTLFAQFWNNVLQDGFLLTGGRFNDPDNKWIFYIDAFNACGQCGGCGGGGVAVISANDLRGLTGLPWIPICPGEGRDYTPCRYIGGLGHELGHAFGLPHPPGCEPYTSECEDSAIMWTGYTIYPDCYFTDSDTTTLLSSPFIGEESISKCIFDCTDLLQEYYFKRYHQAVLCRGDSILLGGEYRQEPGSYHDSLLTVNGCDSILIAELLVHDLPRVNLGNDTAITTLDTLFLNAGTGHMKYSWNTGSSDSLITMANLPVGDHIFTATVTSFHNCTNSDTIIVTVLKDNTANGNLIAPEFSVYPVPAIDQLWIRPGTAIGPESVIELIDYTGKIVLVRKMRIDANTQEISLDLSGILPGFYILRVNGRHKSKIETISIQNRR